MGRRRTPLRTVFRERARRVGHGARGLLRRHGPAFRARAREVGRGAWARLRRHGPVVVLAAAGALLAVALLGSVEAPVGPFDTTMAVDPVGGGGTQVQVAPFGVVSVDSHDGPLGLRLELEDLRLEEARAIARDPSALTFDKASLTDDVDRGIDRLVPRVVLVAVAGGAVGVLAWRRHWRSALVGGLVGLLLAGAAVGFAVATWRPESVAEPRYSGLLRLAPQAIGDADQVLDDFDDHRAQLASLVENLAVLYRRAGRLQSFEPDGNTVAVLHVSDIHLNPQGFDLIDRVVPQFAVDVVVDTGDLNDWGTTIEGRFARRIGDVGVPYVFIRGNHDSRATARAVRHQPNAIVLDDRAADVAGLTFWGIGDPRFTPDKTLEGSGEDQRQVGEDAAPLVAAQLAAEDRPVDVALVHDPAVAADLGGLVPLVLAGHLHRAEQRSLGDGTTLRVEGSTGGAGLRGFQGDDPVPLSCSILYFDARSRRLEAVDHIAVGGIDINQVSIEREVVGPPDDERGAGPGG